MTRLILEAIAEGTIAAAGNRDPTSIALAVSADDGTPITDVDIADIRIDAMIVGVGGVPVRIAGVTPGRLPGTYIAQVVPLREETWKPGGHVFAVAVAHGARRGLTLTRIVLT
ncbi:hypothetical protein [Nannocystis pusilla]|jgi:hypothetical protein|uniref:hypothetical protein n=1 Tax=Nannocystis pusilla TaxID=889268 RepID=UPI003BF231E9